MIIKTQSLTARALDWAVGVAVGYIVDTVRPDIFLFCDSDGNNIGYVSLYCDFSEENRFSPTANWGQIGPLIETHKVQLVKMCSRNGLASMWHGFVCDDDGGDGYFDVDPYSSLAEHEDIKISACRAIVAAKLGDQVDVPEVML